MGNNIIMLPIRGGTYKPSPINQFQEDMETLLYIADSVLQNDLIEDTDADGAAADNWRRYRQIVRVLLIADAFGLYARGIRYRKAPNMKENCATVTITLRKDHLITDKSKSALVAAALFSDSISTAMENDGNTKICFTVYDVR